MCYRIPSGTCDPADDGLHLRGDSNRQRRPAGLRDRGSRRLCRILPRTDTCLKSCRQKSIGPRQRQCAVSPPRLSEMNEGVRNCINTITASHRKLCASCPPSLLPSFNSDSYAYDQSDAAQHSCAPPSRLGAHPEPTGQPAYRNSMSCMRTDSD